MKNSCTKFLISILPYLLISISGLAQAPEKMSYQAVIRNTNGDLVTNHGVGIRISILQSTFDGTPVYVEIYNPNPATNVNGLVTIEIGDGIPVTGNFSDIDWAEGPYFIKTETDPSGGTNYTITGTSQLLSVPYALHAKTVENDKVLTELEVDAYVANNGYLTSEMDGDSSNELQSLSISHDTIYLTNGGSVKIPGRSGPVYYWNQFDTYHNNSGWLMNNKDSLFGGVNPSNWTDGNYRAEHMSTDMNIIRTLFTRKGYGGTNANIVSEVYHSYSSTTGKVTVALFRIRNTTTNDIVWKPYFYYTCYASWNEHAGVSLNHEPTWESGSINSGVNNTATISLNIPANGISTVVFVSPSSEAYSVSPIQIRANILAFYYNSLDLPDGLEYVDDLDTATSWFQSE
jgi:hypothetical protein